MWIGFIINPIGLKILLVWVLTNLLVNETKYTVFHAHVIRDQAKRKLKTLLRYQMKKTRCDTFNKLWQRLVSIIFSLRNVCYDKRWYLKCVCLYLIIESVYYFKVSSFDIVDDVHFVVATCNLHDHYLCNNTYFTMQSFSCLILSCKNQSILYHIMSLVRILYHCFYTLLSLKYLAKTPVLIS